MQSNELTQKQTFFQFSQNRMSWKILPDVPGHPGLQSSQLPEITSQFESTLVAHQATLESAFVHSE